MKQILALVLIVGVNLWTAAFAETYPAYKSVYVNDFANLLDVQQEAEVTAMLTELWQQRHIEFTVVTINSMKDYGFNGEIEPYATRLFNKWGVGDASANDGVMMLVARKDRQMRIELGAGYSQSYNARMQKVIDSWILPPFRKDDYAGGILTGTKYTIYEIAGIYPGEYNANFFAKVTAWAGRLVERFGLWLGLILAPILSIPYTLYRLWERKKPRYCPTDRSRLLLIEESWDDNALQPGQRTEERVGSVDYDVWKCTQCAHVVIEGYRSLFSRYSACRQCGYRTVTGNETVIRSATTSSEGLAEVDYHCENCQARYTVQRTIARRSESSSSHSSFGGGRSSGGGASGRW